MSTKTLGEKSSGEKLDSVSPIFLQKKQTPVSNACKTFLGKNLDRLSPPPKKNLQSRMPTKISWVNFGARTSWGKNLDSKNLQCRMPIKMSWVKFGQHFPLNTKSPESNAFKKFWGKHLDSKNIQSRRPSKVFTRVECPPKFPGKMWTAFPHFPKNQS